MVFHLRSLGQSNFIIRLVFGLFSNGYYFKLSLKLLWSFNLWPGFPLSVLINIIISIQMLSVKRDSYVNLKVSTVDINETYLHYKSESRLAIILP